MKNEQTEMQLYAEKAARIFSEEKQEEKAKQNG